MKLLNLTQVASLFQIRGKPCNRSTIWRWRQAGNFPEPRKRYGAPMWDEKEVEAWLSEHEESGDAHV